MPDDVLGAYPVDIAEAILADYRQRVGESTVAVIGKPVANNPLSFVPPQPTPIYFRNDSGETIPPWGFLQIIDTVNVEDSFCYIIVDRPIDATLMRCPMLVNGAYECLDGEYGCAQQGPVFRMLTDGTAYDPGDRLGPLTATFTATYGSMYAVLGDDDIDTDIVRVMFDTSAMRGKTIDELTAPTPELVLAYDATGTITTKEYTAETLGTSIPADTDVLLISYYGRWFASRIC